MNDRPAGSARPRRTLYHAALCVLAGVIAIPILAVMITGKLTSSPSPGYAHPWCRPVIGQLDNSRQDVAVTLTNLDKYQNVPQVNAYIDDTLRLSNDLADLYPSTETLTATHQWHADQARIRSDCGGRK